MKTSLEYIQESLNKAEEFAIHMDTYIDELLKEVDKDTKQIAELKGEKEELSEQINTLADMNENLERTIIELKEELKLK